MKCSVWIAVLVLFLCSGALLPAEGVTDHQMAEILLKEVWDAMQSKDMALLERKLAQGFQSAHQDGARGRAEELELLRDLDISDYALSDISATREGSLLIVTYFVSVEETIDGKRTTLQKAPRLSVFREQNGAWQWVAHANLKEM
ncbi:MAG: nuclear transport factor 2 family protein [Candidatus Omnitrophota bacterium]